MCSRLIPFSGDERFSDRLAQNREALAQSFLSDRQRRGDFYGLAPCADGREKEQSFVEAALNDIVRERGLRLLLAVAHHLHAADQTTG